ncbi:hypothetical protein Tfer_1611 [Thermincola ferriacetica]|uniref:Acyltransferase 3 domain-containing protein n=1 Tax=Thermincola ferriacetica TaxID=281456 RepID=A0A0L6W2I9_9FIRM|nr:acyltransferase [Thermincola ferriacetica]KNZ69792.1 hypothetical protein Tfer_1611 [Thermincola ferriacetica]
MQQKVEEIALMRGLAIMGIVLLHVTAYFLVAERADFLSFKLALVLNQSVRFCLPLFLIISGFGLAYNYRKTGDIKLSRFFTKRFNKVFIPYIIWSVVYFGFYLTVLGKIPNDAKIMDFNSFSANWAEIGLIFTKNLLFGRNYVHLYFVILIVQFYLLYPFLIKRLSKFRDHTVILLMAFFAYLLLMVYFFHFRKLTGIYLVDWFVKYYWKTFVAWYFYFLLGLSMGLRLDTFQRFAEKYFVASGIFYLVTLALVVAEAFLHPPYDIGRLTSLRVSVLLNTLAAVPFFFKSLNMLKDKLRLPVGILEQMGNNSFGIYFIHLVVIYFFSTIMCYYAPGLFSFYRTSFIISLFLVSILFSLLAVKLFNRLPFGHLLTGVKINRSKAYE